MLLSLEGKLDELRDYIRELITQKYGRKTDQHFRTPGQLLIFPPAEDGGADCVVETSPAKTSSKEQPRKPGHSRNQMPEHLEKIPVVASAPPESELRCPHCKAVRVAVRRLLRHSRYGYVPAKFHIEELYAVVYECPEGHGEPLVAEVGEAVKNGNSSPALIAQVSVARHFDHLPFNRQSAIYERSGVSLRRSTLSDMHAQTALILTPLYMYMHRILLESRIISTDDTPVKVLDRGKEKHIKTGRKWAYMGDKEHPVNLFDYTHGRGRDGPLSFLQGSKAILQGDCFSGNLALAAAQGTVLVACMAHARRYFIKAMLNDKAGCDQALAMFQALYEIERTAKELKLPTDEVQLMRQEESVPLLQSFHKWLQQQYTVAQPKSSFGKALFYCLNNWNELKQYVTDGELSIDNNHTEREMKYVAMGKKAWLFLGSDEGGRNDAIVSSVLSTCRRHGVEPWSYLTDVIQRLAENPATNLEELLPYNWKPKTSVPELGEITVSKDAPKVKTA